MEILSEFVDVLSFSDIFCRIEMKMNADYIRVILGLRLVSLDLVLCR
jgi:hypothetical protein